MIGMRSATTALILVASLAPVAFAQQQPAKPAATPPPPAATPQPQKPAPAPAKPAATAAAPAAATGAVPPTLLGQYRHCGAYTVPPRRSTRSSRSASSARCKQRGRPSRAGTSARRPTFKTIAIKTIPGIGTDPALRRFPGKPSLKGVGVNDQWCISASAGRYIDCDVASHLRSYDRRPVAANSGGTSGQGGRGRRRRRRFAHIAE